MLKVRDYMPIKPSIYHSSSNSYILEEEKKKKTLFLSITLHYIWNKKNKVASSSPKTKQHKTLSYAPLF